MSKSILMIVVAGLLNMVLVMAEDLRPKQIPSLPVKVEKISIFFRKSVILLICLQGIRFYHLPVLGRSKEVHALFR